MQVAKIRKSDGRVIGLGNKSTRTNLAKLERDDVFFVAVDPPLDPGRVYDYRDGQFVEAERSVEPRDVLAARYAALRRLDEMSAGERTLPKDWADYRQALRDVTANGRTVSAMLRQFPTAPDGTDAVAHLRGK